MQWPSLPHGWRIRRHWQAGTGRFAAPQSVTGMGQVNEL
jgi:hypothetical protein